jgi:hypothetical protein
LRFSVKLKSLAAGLEKVSKLTLGRNCAGGGGLLSLLRAGAAVLLFVVPPMLLRTLGGFALLLREPAVGANGTNCTEGRRSGADWPSMFIVGRRQAGMKLEVVVDEGLAGGWAALSPDSACKGRSGRVVVVPSDATGRERGLAGAEPCDVNVDVGAGVPERGDGLPDMVTRVFCFGVRTERRFVFWNVSRFD